MENAQFPAASDRVQLRDIEFTHAKIADVIHDFYTRVSRDPVLRVPFQSVHDWPEHIGRMTHFWWMRLGGRPYLQTIYNPVVKHFQAGFNGEFLARWLALFQQTLATHLDPEQAQLWGELAERIGQHLTMKNEAYGLQKRR